MSNDTARADALWRQVQREIEATYGVCCICHRALVHRGDGRLICIRCHNTDEESVARRMIDVLVNEE